MRSIKELINIKNNTVLITGGGGKIAYAIAEAYAELGAKLILLDNNKSNKNITFSCSESANYHTKNYLESLQNLVLK